MKKLIEGFDGVTEIAKLWHSYITNACRFKLGKLSFNTNFWYYLCRDMEAYPTRSPWETMKSANFAKDLCQYYEDWSTEEIYSLFCDEPRYYSLLDKRDGDSDEEFFHATTDYSVKVEGKLYLITNVPICISSKTGEKLYAPETVEKIQEKIGSGIRRSRFED